MVMNDTDTLSEGHILIFRVGIARSPVRSRCEMPTKEITVQIEVISAYIDALGGIE
jgi:hypothetical protein